MAYDKPTVEELIDQQFADLLALLQEADPSLRDSKVEIFAKVMGGGLNGGYSYLDYILKQLFPDTADEEYAGKWGTTKNLPELEALQSDGTVLMTGNEGSGCSIGDELRRDDGVLFETTESKVIPVGLSVSVAVQATDSGTLGNTNVGELLTFTSVPPGVNSQVTVEDMTGGTNDETPEEYTERVIQSFRFPARGGADYDYEAWSKESTDVSDAWVKSYHPSINPDAVLQGDVLLYFMMYDTYSDGIPQAGDVADVQAYVDDRRPTAMGDFLAKAPTKEELDMTISISPDTSQGRTEVEAQLADFIQRTAEPNGVLRISNINESISRALSVDYHTVTVPAGDATPALPANIFSLGTITWS